MRVNDLVYFAPGIRFDEVDISGPGLPKQFRQRIVELYLDPADSCAARGQGFAAGVLVLSCIDALARFQFGGGVGQRNKAFLGREVKSFSERGDATALYEDFRNGLVHEARIKKGGQFSLETDQTVLSMEGRMIVNPARLIAEVRIALDAYIALLETVQAERSKLSAILKADYATDLR